MRRRTLIKAGLTAPIGAVGVAGCVQSPPSPAFGSHRALILRDDPDYERWRQGMAWQTYKHARYPDVIARPRTAVEVADAVRYARRNRLKVVVRSGGHNVSGAFFRDGGLLLDLGAFRSVQIDAPSATAWVQPALWSRNLALQLGANDFAFPYAHCGTVPMGGYLLGGGVGMNGDNWGGMACANILEAEVVLASGEVVRASADEHTELLWAVRGSGTGFPGIVTGYRLALHPAPKVMTGSTYVFPLPAAAEAAAWMNRVRGEAPPDTELMMLLAHTPQGPVAMARFVVFTDDADSAEKLLGGFARAPEAQKAVARMERVPTDFEGWFRGSVDYSVGLGFGSYGVETIWTDRLPETVDALTGLFSRAPSPMSHVLISPRIHTAPPADSAFSVLGESFLGVYSVWNDGRNRENLSWLEECALAMEPFGHGRYVNETDGFVVPERVHSAFSETAWTRIGQLRRRVDPDGVFFGFPGWEDRPV